MDLVCGINAAYPAATRGGGRFISVMRHQEVWGLYFWNYLSHSREAASLFKDVFYGLVPLLVFSFPSYPKWKAMLSSGMKETLWYFWPKKKKKSDVLTTHTSYLSLPWIQMISLLLKIKITTKGWKVKVINIL